jgi:putative peptide zinc metalloprotease protein
MENYYLADTLSMSLTDNADLDKRYCIFIGSRVFHGSERVAQLFEAVSLESDLTAITARLNASGNGRQVTAEQIRAVIEKQFISDGLIVTVKGGGKPEAGRKGYLFFSKTLLSAATVGRLAIPLRVLFAPPVALVLLLLAFMLVAWYWWAMMASGLSFALALTSFSMSIADTLLFYGLMLACFLFHEFGHAAASSRFGSKPAEIGIGLYLVFPVLFCNVTEAWRLPRMQRVVVNFGGAYFQLLALALLVPFQLWSHSALLTLVIALNLMSILVTLNPFFRFDGYWVYSDFFSLPNLRERSRQWMMDALAKLLSLRVPPKVPNATLPLQWYGVGSALFFCFFSFTLFTSGFGLIAKMPVLLHGVMNRLQDNVRADTVFEIISGSALFLVYAAGCLLTLLYIVSTLMRGVGSVRQMLKSGKPGAAESVGG